MKKVSKKGVSSSQIKPPVISTHTLRNTGKIILRSDNVIPSHKSKVNSKVTQVKLPIKKAEEKTEIVQKKVLNLRRSIDIEKSDDSSLYVSALEDVSESSTKKSDKIHEKVSNFITKEGIQIINYRLFELNITIFIF